MKRLLLLLSLSLALLGCAPAPRAPRFEFHPHPDLPGIWRCDLQTGHVDFGLVNPSNGTLSWITAAPEWKDTRPTPPAE